MQRQFRGVVFGKSIELGCKTGLPDGTAVIVELYAADPDASGRTKKLRSLCGSWTDSSLDSVFAEIEQARAAATPTGPPRP